MSLPLKDIRHDFFHALDHFPSDLVRTLWLLQSIDVQLNECYNNTSKIGNEESSTYFYYLQSQLRKQSVLLLKLVQDQKNILNRERVQLNKQLHTRNRYQNFIKKINETKLTVHSHQNTKSNEVSVDIENTEDQDLEPRYCICNDVSYGDMIACDNDDCPKQWFHCKCVHISVPPKGKWYCSTECELHDRKSKNKKTSNKTINSNSRGQEKKNNKQALKIAGQIKKVLKLQNRKGRRRRKKIAYTL